WALYRAYAAGNESPLKDLDVQYGDYAVWQREWLQGPELDRQLLFWKRQLNGIKAVDLPTDRGRPAIQTYDGGVEVVTLGEQVTRELNMMSRRESATMFMLTLAIFKVLLYRYSSQEDISVGTPIANRNRAEIEGLIGFLANTLVLRDDLGGQPTFRG